MNTLFDCGSPNACLCLFHQMFDTAPFPVSVSEVSAEDQPTIYINPAFTQLTGHQLHEIEGRNCRILQGDQTGQPNSLLLRKAIMRNEEAQTELVNYRKDGSVFYNFVRLFPLQTKITGKRYMLGIQLDVTALFNTQLAYTHAMTQGKIKEKQSLHQEQLNSLGQMAASMAHEINNPIAGVLMNLEYLRISAPAEAERQEVLTESLDELKRVSRLVKSMLSFSRTKQEVSLKVCSFICFWQEARTMIEPILKGSMTPLVMDFEQADWNLPVLMNLDEMKQIVLNLINNAVQAMEHLNQRERCVTLEVNRKDGSVVLSIAGVGNGVPEALHEKIFNPFFTTKPEGQGTGLGLSLSAKMIEDMGGKLSLDKDYTQGARFLLSFPIAAKKTNESEETR